ncbi:hypothetical protein M406DRAFT_67920 [Cryphonectria parasitica EP155]|uniref:GTPase-activating protein GYP5 n=1 Tax=Cryphonectria parasitica (strain ATCC 38755 / EP155) TaxID=660469 RepID=A0A9P4Y2J4_CRYP1|nr:uncharacterized protein M406DRAFT_67920 [Cryphonectria parasitica EP155]KAF3765478.1 hypothetical protein M406DRAFT_67920 [Cryphonectria parasitica EP155]
MSEHGETAVMAPVSPPRLDRKDSETASLADSDKDTDNFEDARDAAPESSSVRSLTQRRTSHSKTPAADDEIKEEGHAEPEGEHKKPPSSTESESGLNHHEQKPSSVHEAEVQDKDEFEEAETTSIGDSDEVTLAQQRLSVQSSGQLDNVSLDDEDLDGEKKGPNTGQRLSKKLVWLTGHTAEVEKVNNVGSSDAEPEPPKKTISLGSITNSLPAMPWSPGAQGSSTKNLDTPPTAAPAAAAAAAPTTPGAPLPANSTPAATAAAAPPPSRKLAGAFSWLSRSSSKDLTNVSPPVTARRNTASSTTTLTSNPEMLLGKLDEEGGARNVRHSLKDRFKAMRMREEAGITNLPEDGDASGIANLVNKGPNGALGSPTEEKEAGAVQPPPSPRPAHATLAPGTASGAAAGPSTLSDEPVDWDLWQSVVYEGPAAVAKTSAEELRKATAAGIPSAIRGVIWQVLAQSQSEELEAVYRDLVARGTDKEKDRQSNGSPAGSNGSTPAPGSSASSVHSEGVGSQPPSPPPKDTPKDEAAEKKKKKEDVAMIQRLEKTIRRDLGQRTAYSKFAAAQGLQEGLFGVCKAYALFDEEVGYAQGMNFLIMPLLFNMSEEEAFCLLVKLMNNYHLRDLFIQDMPGLHMHLYQFERLLEDTEPALYCHLRRRGISPHLYATQWFLTLFSYRFPLQLVLRIYDLILSEGLSAILKFGIVLMQKNTETLLGMTDMAQLTTYLRDRLFDVYIESAPTANSILENGFFGSSTSSMDKEVYRADQLVHDACEAKLTPDILQAWRLEWEEKTREEKERQQELETLRSQNTSYAAKIRKLEERLQAVDREQADLATELVHTKVENEELKDQNESLTGQVRELKIVIEKQPIEIEDQWKLERDALIERNQRVHEENEKVEKEMAELEEQLVQTKMQYAEINSQHETLQRKWNELKRTFA